MRLRVALAIPLSACLVASPAFAEADWFASLYTGEGVELRADARVFALYAVLNALGYDRAPLARKEPIPKYAFHPVREQVRAKLMALAPTLRQGADAYFDAHPQPIERYVAFAVGGPKGAADLKGFDSVLSNAEAGWNLAGLLADVQGEYRKALKGYLPALDVPLGRARQLLRVPEDSQKTVLIMNLLDGQDEAHGVAGDGGIVVVVGPSDKPNVAAWCGSSRGLFWIRPCPSGPRPVGRGARRSSTMRGRWVPRRPRRVNMRPGCSRMRRPWRRSMRRTPRSTQRHRRGTSG
jgi:hypothetical protein